MVCAFLQVVHCYAEVACPEAAAAHQRCFQRVVNSQGGEPYKWDAAQCGAALTRGRTIVRAPLLLLPRKGVLSA